MKIAVAILKAIAQCPSMILPVTFRWCFRSVSASGLKNRKSRWRAVRKSSGGALQAGDHADESTFPTSGFALAFDIYSQTDHASKNLSYFLLGNMIWFSIKHIELIVEIVWNIQFNLNYSWNLSKKNQSIWSENFERKLGSRPSHLWQCFSIEVSNKGQIFN